MGRSWNRSKRMWITTIPLESKYRKKPWWKMKPKKRSLKKKMDFPTRWEMENYAEKRRQELLFNETPEEKILGEALTLAGIDFVSQKIIMTFRGFRIVDFYVDNGVKKLCIELDGRHHFTKQGRKQDCLRTNELKRDKQIRIMRFANSEIRSNIGKVIAYIKNWLDGKHDENRMIGIKETKSKEFLSKMDDEFKSVIGV